MRSALRFCTALAVFGLLVGCGRLAPEAAPSHNEASSGDEGAMAKLAAQAPMAGEMAAPGAAGADQSSTVSLASQTASSTQRYIIRDATITVETPDARKAAASLTKTAGDLGGYAGNSSEEVDALGARSATVQVRVPAKRFDELMRAVDALGTVLSRNVTTQDVTEEFVDTEARLRNLRSTEQRLLSHLNKTGKLSDTLMIERELARVRGEVEQHEGRMRYLSHSVSYSTATVICRDRARREPVVPPESFSTAQVASSATRALVELARGVWTMVIWVGVWSVVWLPIVVFLLWLSRSGGPGRRPRPPEGP